ncbi:MAG: hypothetical protein LBE69_23020, partial [Klebsiella sp.]
GPVLGVARAPPPAPLAGLGGETMLKMSLAMAICYLLALLMGLSQPRSAR